MRRWLSLFVSLALLGAGVALPVAPAPAADRVTETWTWDTQADFEANASTTGETVSRTGLSTTVVPDSIVLQDHAYPSPVVMGVEAGRYHTAGLKSDGTAVAAGSDTYGECNVSGWTDLVAVSAGNGHTVGVESDGTAVAVGSDTYGECNVSGWTDLVAIAAGGNHTVGLKADGTAVAVGDDGYGQCNVSAWTDLVAIAAGGTYTVGLKSDGTAVAVGNCASGQCDVSAWTDLVAIAACSTHTVGLKADSTAVAVGTNDYGRCDVSGWTDLVAITAGVFQTVGLKADGTAVAVGGNNYGECNVSAWTDLVAITAYGTYTVGLKSDGTAVAVGSNDYGQCDVSGWSSGHDPGLRLGTIGGTGAVGLRAAQSVGEGTHPRRWTTLSADVSTLAHGESVKIAVRVSDDGLTWSGPLGRDGRPVDWTDGTGTYFGSACGDFAWYGTLDAIPAKPYLDLEVRLSSVSMATPVLRSLTVTAVNDAPVAVADSYTTAEDTAKVMPVLSNDTDAEGDALVPVKLSSPGYGTVVVNPDGTMTYTPVADFYGYDSFIYRVSDGELDSGPVIVDITVTAVNDAPVAVADSYTTAEDTVLSKNAAAGVLSNDSDAESDPLTVSLVSGVSHGALTLNANGSFTYTPAADYLGYDSFTYKLSDGKADSNTVTVTIPVTGVNDAPVLGTIGNRNVNEGSLLTFTATAIDPDIPANTLTFGLDAGSPVGAAIDPVTGVFTWTPSEAQGTPGASYEATVTVSDGVGGTDSEKITITVAEANVAPVLGLIGPQSVNELAELTFTATATDADLPPNTLTFSLGAGAPAGAAIDPATGVFTWTPTEVQGPGSHDVTVVVSDGTTTDTEIVSITVTEVNVAPVLDPIGPQSVDELSELTFTATATDADVPANTLTFSLGAGAPAGAAIDPATGAFTWTPTEVQGPGSHDVTVVVSDGTTTDTEIVSITVTEVNVAPVATDDSYTSTMNTPLVQTAPGVLSNDTDADVPANTLTATKVTDPSHGAVTLASDGSFTYTPEAGYTGADSFTYKANDGTADSNTVTVLVTVSAPTAVMVPVYRFYNVKTGVHFYTASETEKAAVIKNLSAIYHYEGVAYKINVANPDNAYPLYRFYNVKAGVHFYTASETEKNNVIATLGATYKLEGIAYKVAKTPTNAFPVWRFYNFKAGVHFYTASASEKDNVDKNLKATYKLDGIGYYVAQ